MELTFTNDLGQSFVVEVPEDIELENLMGLLEAESNIPASEQSITHNGRELNGPNSTLRQLGVEGTSAMLLLRRKVATVQGGAIPQDAEMMRLQMLGDPELMRQLREVRVVAHAPLCVVHSTHQSGLPPFRDSQRLHRTSQISHRLWRTILNDSQRRCCKCDNRPIRLAGTGRLSS
ncbi:hypothetical protein FA15DRAFT_453033 [Coprinopsis marcescibilis]|uniref:Ubiquitin-like domain-containing protein n=1 Tax=Coprinopsis marcescibilis TaxID=230819 RepID=A0A5C3L8U4_COPMA|nr:hypothetical protein FA15DRAFT_453033 [Coprinopsis marcescibilis]